MKIHFFTEDYKFAFKRKAAFKHVVGIIESDEKCKFENINVIFCSDEYLKGINRNYLKRDYLTDIITFPYSRKKINGDIFISIDRIKENALRYNVTFDMELSRVLIHGMLHLCGYEDCDQPSKNQMTTLEDKYLNFF